MNRNFVKKILSLLLSLTIIVGALPAMSLPVNAEVVPDKTYNTKVNTVLVMTAADIFGIGDTDTPLEDYFSTAGFSQPTKSDGTKAMLYNITPGDYDYLCNYALSNDSTESFIATSAGTYTFTAEFYDCFVSEDVPLYSKTIAVNVADNTPPPTYTINSISNQTLDNLTAGYTAGSQVSKEITITKSGTGDLSNLAVSISGTNSSSFTITQPSATTLNTATASTKFTVKAKDNLPVGTYSATVTVLATSMTPVTFTVTQVVNAASGVWVKKVSGTDSEMFSDVIYANGYWLAIGYNSGNIYKSTDNGNSWNLISTIGAGVYGIAYGNGRFVATNNNHATAYISNNGGISWTPVQVDTQYDSSIYRDYSLTSLTGITYGDNGFVAAGTWSSSYGAIYQSDDGITWHRRFFQCDPNKVSGLALSGVAYGNGTYVVTGYNGRIYTSTDTVNWSLASVPNSDYYMSVTYNDVNTAFYAVSMSGSILVSYNNGSTWQSVFSDTSKCFEDIAYGNGLYYAVGDGGYIAKSTDGTHWSADSYTAAQSLYTICFAAKYFIAAGDYGCIIRNETLPNTVPSFNCNTNTLTIDQNTGATDIKNLLYVSDADSGQTLIWSQKTAPNHGTLSFSGTTASSGGTNIAPGGTITYTPAAGYLGTDNFTVKISDGITTSVRTIIVTINDTVAPTGDITVGTTHWKSFLNSISFGLFFKDTTSVTITAADNGSGVKSIQYYKSATSLSAAGVQALTSWSNYSSTLSLPPIDAEQFVIYAKITDNAGNVTYISSDGMEFDLKGPSITTNYTKDATSMEVTVTDSGSGVKTVSYTVNGGSAQTAILTNSKFTIPTLADGKYDVVITAKDTLDNQSSITVNVVSLHTVTFKLFDGDTCAALKTETVEYNSGATAPSNPTRTGFDFKTWDKSFSTITADTTVNATWNIGGITVTPYSGTYDTAAHNAVTVTGTLAGDAITYSTNGTTYTSTCPQYINAGSYPIYVKVSRTGYTDWTSNSVTALINQTAGSITISGDISKTYDGNPVSNPVVSKNGTGAVEYIYYKDSPIAGNILATPPSAVGTYWVGASMAEDTNYTAAETLKQFTISLASISGSVSIPATVLTGSTVSANISGALPAGITFSYEWRLNGTAIPGETNSSYTVKESDYAKALTVALIANGNYTGSITSNSVTISENVAPTGIITQGTNNWNRFFNTITFGLFFKETATFSIVGNDNGGSGVASIQYYKSTSSLSTAEVQAITGWVNGTLNNGATSFSVTPTDAEKFIVYAKITDNAGNVTYINSNGMQFDLTGPSITTNYTKDATSMEVTVTDSISGVKSVTYIVNGGSLQNATLANGKFTIASLAEGKYNVVITAKDDVGNEYTLTVNVVSLYTVTFKLFDGDTGAALNTETVEYGGSATAPTDLTRNGFTFKSWDKSFTGITSDTTVNATWNISGITVTPYSFIYDGTAHDAVTVNGTLAGDTITYSTNGTNFSPTCPQYTNTGSYPVYVKVTRTGYTTWESGLKTAVIDRASGSITISSDLSKTYDGSAVSNPSVNKNGGGAVTYTYYNDNSGSIGTSLSNAPSAAGTYWVKVVMSQDTNYTAAEATRKFTIGLAAIMGSVSIPQTVLTGSNVTADISGALPTGVTFGYQWKLNGTAIPGATGSIYAVQETDYGKTLSVVLTANGNFTGSITSSGVIIGETVAPTGEIKQGINSWKSFWNGLTFGLFFKDTVTITISANDMGGSGVAKTEYYKSDKELKTMEEVQSITNWQPYPSSGLPLTPTDAEKFVIYARITDNAGNVSYINSNGMEFDLTSPTISTNYTKDATSMEVTVADSGSGVKTVTYVVNGGNAQTAALDANGKFTISSLAEGKYDVVITAQDTLGNEKSLTVNVVSVYTVIYKLFNGDTGTALKTETVEYGSSAAAPTDPTRTGFTFKGWDTNSNNITADTTVNATWDISGITATPYTGTFDGVAHNAVTVTGTLTGDSITYSINGTDFTGICPQYTKAGNYQIYIKVARAGYTTWESGLKTVVIDQKAITADMIDNIPSVEYTAQPIMPLLNVKYGTIVLINDTDFTVSYTNNTEIGLATVAINGKGDYTGTANKTFAIYAKNTGVEIKDEQTPPVVATGLEKLYEDDTIYTPEDRQIEQDGGSIKIELSVQLKADITQDKGKIDAVATNKTIGMFLDLSLFKTVTAYGAETGTVTTLSHLNSLLTVVIPIPDDMKSKKGIAMYRVHEGVAFAIPIGEDKAIDGEYCTISADSITLYVRNFSTYAIGYDDENVQSGTTPTTGDSLPVTPLVAGLIGAAVVLAFTKRRKVKV